MSWLDVYAYKYRDISSKTWVFWESQFDMFRYVRPQYNCYIQQNSTKKLKDIKLISIIQRVCLFIWKNLDKPDLEY